MVRFHLVGKYDSDPMYSFQVMLTDRQTNSRTGLHYTLASEGNDPLHCSQH